MAKIDSQTAYLKLTAAVNLKYYIGAGCAEAIRDACMPVKPTFKPAEKVPERKVPKKVLKKAE